MARAPQTLRAFCLRILESGDLESKLAPAPPSLDDANPGEPVLVLRPSRDDDLSLSSGAARLPRPTELEVPEARARCLARFAHHELMAVELFAWALLRWPELPAGMRRDFQRVLADEQRHCRLYLERLAAHGDTLADHARSDYFWKHAPAIAASPFGPRAFLCAMGLTLEQANLDFSALYRDAFRAAGDGASAQVCARVHDDEVRHVALAATWLRRLDRDRSDIESYTEAVPFPFAASRAKGRRFDAEARRRAGLSEDFIETVRAARSSPKRQRR